MFEAHGCPLEALPDPELDNAHRVICTIAKAGGVYDVDIVSNLFSVSEDVAQAILNCLRRQTFEECQPDIMSETNVTLN